MQQRAPGVLEQAEGGIQHEHRTTLAQALALLRRDLDAQQPPAAILAAAKRSAQRLPRPSAPADRPAEGMAASRGRRGWRPAALTAWAWPADWRPWAGAATCAAVLGISLLLALRPPHSQPPGHAMAGAVDFTGAGPGSASDPARGGSTGPGGSAGGAGGEAAVEPAMHFVPLVGPERLRALAAAPTAAGVEQAPRVATAAWVVTAEFPQQRLAAMGLPYDPGRAAEPLRAELLVAGNGEVLAVRLTP